MPDPGINTTMILGNISLEHVGLIVTICIAFLGFPGIYNKWQEWKKEKELKSQLDSSIRDAGALLDSAEHKEAINKYDCLLKTISPEKYPAQWGNCKNSMGIAYFNLALINNKELNLKRGIQAYQEALKISTTESYPIDYAMTQNNLGNALDKLRRTAEADAKPKELGYTS